MPTITEIEVAFHKVRQELCDLGLLADGHYLDDIDVCLFPWPAGSVAGFVYDPAPWVLKQIGFREGAIYIPRWFRPDRHAPGYTLTDVVRHEFGHAWAWYDPEFFGRPWFERAFGRGYHESWPTGEALWKVFGGNPDEFKRSPYWRDYVTPYALTNPAEDFCETFWTYLRYRRSLRRFGKRPGVYRKLKAVEKAVRTAARELGL